MTMHSFSQKGWPPSLPSSGKGRISFALCLPCLVDFVNIPTIQAGMEYRLSSHISWYNELGIQYVHLRADTSFLTPHGFKLKTELRYYYKKVAGARTPAKEYYYGINAFYNNSSYNRQITYYPKNDTAVDGYGVRKQVLGGNLLLGVQMGGGRGKFTKKFLFDLYMGLGVRFRWINTISKDVGESNINWAIDFPNIFRETREPEIVGGFSTRPNLTLGVRLCYRL